MKLKNYPIRAALRRLLSLFWLFAISCFPSLLFAQVIFHDDFTNGNLSANWNSPAYAQWSIVGDQAYNAIDGSGGILLTNQAFAATSYYLESQAGPFEEGYWREHFLVFGAQDSTGDLGYAVRIDATFEQFQLIKSTGNIYFPQVLVQVDTALSETATYRIRVERENTGLIRVFLAEEGQPFPATPIISHTDTTYTTLGFLGWHIATQTAAQDFFVDYVLAGQLTNTLLCDDFERSQLGNLWDNDGTWSIQNGNAYHFDGYGRLLSAPEFSTDTYIIESAASNLVTGYYRQYYLFFGLENDDLNTGYALEIDAYSNTYLLSLNRNEGNFFFPDELDEVPIKLDASLQYSFRIEKYKNGLIQVYINDGSGYGTTPILEAIDTTYVPLGTFGWLARTETVSEEFFVDAICATLPAQQKTQPQKPAGNPLIAALYAESNNEYALGTMQVNETHYTDRPYIITSLPPYLQGATFIKTPNDDKPLNASGDFLDVYLNQPFQAFVAYDPRGTTLPAWLSSWTNTGDIIGSTDIGTSTYTVYTKVVSTPGFYTGYYFTPLGTNLAPPAVGSNAMYFVAFKPIETVRYEAEDAFLSGPQIISENTGFSGTGYADYGSTTGEYIQWTIDAPTPATYSFTFRFANGGTTNRPLTLTIDGQTINTYAFSSTNGWSNWASLGNIRKELDAGTHTVRLTATGSSGPNIDYLQIAPSAFGPNVRLAEEATPLQQEVNKQAVSAYPNPGNNRLYITGAVSSGAAVKVFTLTGAIMYQGTSEAEPSGKLQWEIDTQSWPAGMYLYQVEDANGITTGKWMKE